MTGRDGQTINGIFLAPFIHRSITHLMRNVDSVAKAPVLLVSLILVMSMVNTYVNIKNKIAFH